MSKPEDQSFDSPRKPNGEMFYDFEHTQIVSEELETEPIEFENISEDEEASKNSSVNQPIRVSNISVD